MFLKLIGKSNKKETTSPLSSSTTASPTTSSKSPTTDKLSPTSKVIDWRGDEVVITGKKFIYRKIGDDLAHLYDPDSYAKALITPGFEPEVVKSITKKDFPKTGGVIEAGERRISISAQLIEEDEKKTKKEEEVEKEKEKERKPSNSPQPKNSGNISSKIASLQKNVIPPSAGPAKLGNFVSNIYIYIYIYICIFFN